MIAHEVDGQHLEKPGIHQALVGDDEGHIELFAESLCEIFSRDEFGFDKDSPEYESGALLETKGVFQIVLSNESLYE